WGLLSWKARLRPLVWLPGLAYYCWLDGLVFGALDYTSGVYKVQAVAFAPARRCGYGAWVAWPVALAGLLALQYVDVTTPWVRQHDVGGHREYIDHLSARRTLPGVAQGWETWQPPLYYVVAALWHLPFPRDAFDDPFRPVQFLSAALYLGVIAAGILLFRRLQFNGEEAVGAHPGPAARKPLLRRAHQQ
ncbi:MAG TPA: hypothetical protein VG146_18900, partial [Verrucomicrobiae bacterium]|nr:hypothetical protein [Verrucomicrobiae bacterium]